MWVARDTRHENITRSGYIRHPRESVLRTGEVRGVLGVSRCHLFFKLTTGFQSVRLFFYLYTKGVLVEIYRSINFIF